MKLDNTEIASLALAQAEVHADSRNRPHPLHVLFVYASVITAEAIASIHNADDGMHGHGMHISHLTSHKEMINPANLSACHIFSTVSDDSSVHDVSDGMHMTPWHIPLAISVQQANLPNRSLTFAPKVAAPYSVGIPVGMLSSESNDSSYSLRLTVGSLELGVLAADGHVAPGALVRLTAGEAPVVWGAHFTRRTVH